MKEHRQFRRGTGSIRKQQGLTTVVVAMVILVLISMVSVYTAKSIFIEQKISSSELRFKQAFEAAEAGLAVAVAYANTGIDKDDDGAVDQLVDTDGDALGLGDSDMFLLGNSRAMVTARDLSGKLTRIELTSRGFSSDGVATRVMMRVLNLVDPIPNMPMSPVTSRGALVINGSATVHNPQGNSTIWSGGNVEMGSNNATATEVANMTDPNYPACMNTPMTCSLVRSSNKVTIGLDVVENDGNLSNLTSNLFFKNFFGMIPEKFKTLKVTKTTDAFNAAADLDKATEEIIWVDGDLNINNVTMGCRISVNGNNVCPVADQKPSILIIDGDADFGGGQYYGVIFVTGNAIMSGNTTVHGAIMTAGTMTNKTGGSLDIWYNTDILTKSHRLGPLSSSSGTWKDF